MPTFLERLIVSLVGGSLAVVAAPGLAEEATSPAAIPEAAQVLPDTVVSADKDVPVQDRTELGRLTKGTPIAGTVVGREDLETVKFVDSFHELLPRVPGISMSRNLRFSAGGKNYTENRVDGMRARNTGTFGFVDQVNSADIERVEFTTGPGSVLSGSNAIGGTINVITRDPPRAAEAKISVDGDNYYKRADVMVGGPVSAGAGYFLDVNHLDKSGWRPQNAEEKTAFSTKWVILPDDVSRLTVRLEYLDDDYESPGSLTAAQFEDDWRQAQPNYYSRTDVQYRTPSVMYKRSFVGGSDLAAYWSRRKTEQVSYSQSSATRFNVSDSDGTENNLQLIYKQAFDPARSALTGGLDLVVTHSESIKYNSNAAYDRLSESTSSASDELHKSPFLQYEFSPLEPLRLTLGVRADRIRYEIDDRLATNKDGDKDYARLTRKFGATFSLGRDNLLWANVAEGFLAPGVGTLLGSGTAPDAAGSPLNTRQYVPANMDLEPETSLTREFGLRGSLAERRVSYDVAFYDTQSENMTVQENCALSDTCKYRNVAAGSASLRGIEAVLGYRALDWLALGWSHTYTEHKYVEYVSGTSNYSGKWVYYTPRTHYNARVTLYPAAGWKAEIERDHIGAYWSDQDNTVQYERPDLTSVRVGYDARSYAVWAQVLNATNEKYAERQGYASGQYSYTDGYAPRTLRFGASYKW